MYYYNNAKIKNRNKIVGAVKNVTKIPKSYKCSDAIKWVNEQSEKIAIDIANCRYSHEDPIIGFQYIVTQLNNGKKKFEEDIELLVSIYKKFIGNDYNFDVEDVREAINKLVNIPVEYSIEEAIEWIKNEYEYDELEFASNDDKHVIAFWYILSQIKNGYQNFEEDVELFWEITNSATYNNEEFNQIKKRILK